MGQMAGSVNYEGRVFGNWELLGLLGQGSFGAVYEARHRLIAGRSAAIKVLYGHVGHDELVRQRFLNEASAASRADHPHIIQVFDVGQSDEGLCYVVMERLRGQRLSDLIAAGPMHPMRAADLCAQVASALAAAHQAAVVHRDLKPDNIFVVQREDSADFVKVLDFGIAKLWDRPSLTASNVMMGTPAYMAPEQWRAEQDIDGRADIYALGVILFECLVGARPFVASNHFGYFDAHLNQTPPDLAQLSPDLPSALCALVQRMLSKDRAGRPAEMREVAQRLRALAQAGPRPSLSDQTLLLTSSPDPGSQKAVARAIKSSSAAGLRPAVRRAGLVVLLVLLSGGSYRALRGRPLTPSPAPVTTTDVALVPVPITTADLAAVPASGASAAGVPPGAPLLEVARDASHEPTRVARAQPLAAAAPVRFRVARGATDPNKRRALIGDGFQKLMTDCVRFSSSHRATLISIANEVRRALERYDGQRERGEPGTERDSRLSHDLQVVQEALDKLQRLCAGP